MEKGERINLRGTEGQAPQTGEGAASTPINFWCWKLEKRRKHIEWNNGKISIIVPRLGVLKTKVAVDVDTKHNILLIQANDAEMAKILKRLELVLPEWLEES